MVAYSFKPSFVRPIEVKSKRQTIRLPRKRHARPGEALQFFTGPRMGPDRLGSALCVAVREVRLDFDAGSVTLDDFEVIEGAEGLNAFAVRDGFAPPARLQVEAWAYMAKWWALTHPGQPVFRGVLIDWDETFTAVEVAR